jgi:uncharacterized protein (DUF1499 family)
MLMATSAFGGLFSGTRPDNLGVHEQKLAPCPDKPNCVNSQASDSRHAIAPLAFTGAPDAAMKTLAEVIAGTPRTTVVTRAPDYLYVEFASKVMGFVDDVEFALDRQAKSIHVRSASRLGHGDFGVNRERIETLRTAFASHKP